VTPHISIHSPVYDDLESRCIGTKLTSLSVMSTWLFTRFWATKFPAPSLPSEPGSRSSVWTSICDRPLQFQHLILGLLTLDRYSVIRSCMIRPCATFGAIKFSFLLLRKTEEFYLKKILDLWYSRSLRPWCWWISTYQSLNYAASNELDGVRSSTNFRTSIGIANKTCINFLDSK